MDRVLIRLVGLLGALLTPEAARADALVGTKTVTVISDPMGNPLPRSLPGAVMDYRLNVSNPLGNLLKPVKSVVIVENIPDNCDLQVTDLASAGRGPVEFLDGNLLGTGLLGSGLTFTYNPAAVDSVEFYSEGAWTSTTSATSGSYNPSIRAVRITLAGTFATSTAFQLRYRVRIR